jgi:hypothetical protein
LYGSPAALPISAPFVFESKTTGRNVSPSGFFVGFRVRMQPQTMNAVTIAQKITNGISCIVIHQWHQLHCHCGVLRRA